MAFIFNKLLKLQIHNCIRLCLLQIMYKILVVFLVGMLDAKILQQDVIRPTRQEISKCMPEKMQSKTNSALVKLEKIATTVDLLNQETHGLFKKNCKKLAKLLDELDTEQVLDKQNISSKIGQKKRKEIFKIINKPDKVWKRYLSLLGGIDKNLGKHIKKLQNLFQKTRAVTLVELIDCVDSIQVIILELSQMFQVLSTLDFAREEINGYEIILSGIQEQLFLLTVRVNEILQTTQELRGSYLNLLDKGDCSGDAITVALGIVHKKRAAIANE